MSPLLIFILVVLFIVSGLLLLRDTAFLNRQSDKPVPHRRQPDPAGSSDDTGIADASASPPIGRQTDKNADSQDADTTPPTDSTSD
ncbi:MAG TPA: hypothetical protein VFV64_01400 [Permianibacter sp.]|nr:hypothetical protein [Permianibacter sp.]